MINGNGLHHVAIIRREGSSITDGSPHAHIKCVVGGRLFSVVQPKYKIMFPHRVPEHEVLRVTKLRMNSSMSVSNVRVELSWRNR